MRSIGRLQRGSGCVANILSASVLCLSIFRARLSLMSRTRRMVPSSKRCRSPTACKAKSRSALEMPEPAPGLLTVSRTIGLICVRKVSVFWIAPCVLNTKNRANFPQCEQLVRASSETIPPARSSSVRALWIDLIVVALRARCFSASNKLIPKPFRTGLTAVETLTFVPPPPTAKPSAAVDLIWFCLRCGCRTSPALPGP